jgi:hypothetical protein
MGANDITSDEQIDRGGTTDTDIAARLNVVLGIQTKNTGRLNAIAEVSINPGPPGGPDICDQIIAQANASIAAASLVKRKFTGG